MKHLSSLSETVLNDIRDQIQFGIPSFAMHHRQSLIVIQHNNLDLANKQTKV